MWLQTKVTGRFNLISELEHWWLSHECRWNMNKTLKPAGCAFASVVQGTRVLILFLFDYQFSSVMIAFKRAGKYTICIMIGHYISSMIWLIDCDMAWIYCFSLVSKAPLHWNDVLMCSACSNVWFFCSVLTLMKSFEENYWDIYGPKKSGYYLSPYLKP